MREELVEAAHPRSIERLTDETIDLLVKVMMLCEEEGEWPRAVALVIIAFLPTRTVVFNQ